MDRLKGKGLHLKAVFYRTMAKVLRRSAQQFIQQVIESEIEPYMDQVKRTSEDRLDVDNDYLPTKTGQN